MWRSQTQEISARAKTEINVNRNEKKQNANRTKQRNFYARSVTSKFGISSSSAKCSANMYRTQLSRIDNNEVYIH